MSATARSIRQSTADHAGRESRIEAVTRDLIADVEYYTEDGEPTAIAVREEGQGV